MINVVIKNYGYSEVPITQPFITELYVDNKLSETWKFPFNEEDRPLKPFGGGARLLSYYAEFNESGKHYFRWIVDANALSI